MKKIKVAITGGIGAGKSLVTNYLGKNGYPIISADDLAKNLMQTNPSLKKKIIDEFGSKAYDGDVLNKKFLAVEVFSDQEKVEKINSIIHPVVIRKIEEECKKSFKDHDIVFIESALVFEAKIRKIFNYIILVTADEDTRIKRIMLRDDVTEEEVRARMQFQMDDEKKIQLSDFVFHNTGTLMQLEDKCKFVLHILKSLTA